MDIVSIAPSSIGHFPISLPEFMHYQYLPVRMFGIAGYRIPRNLSVARGIVRAAENHALNKRGRVFRYAYVTAKRGTAVPGNPLNRPGWHSDGFGTEDLNYIWWQGTGTMIANQTFNYIPDNHITSLVEFETQIIDNLIVTPCQQHLYPLDATVVHSAPNVNRPESRQFIKVSLSNKEYNLEGNSHNYDFDYAWKMVSRDEVRNDPHRAQTDSA